MSLLVISDYENWVFWIECDVSQFNLFPRSDQLFAQRFELVDAEIEHVRLIKNKYVISVRFDLNNHFKYAHRRSTCIVYFQKSSQVDISCPQFWCRRFVNED